MYSCKIQVGDASHDGHGQCDIFNLVSNMPKEDVQEAYKLGSTIVGFDFANTACEDYEDSSIDNEYGDMLKEIGINLSKVDEYDERLHFDSESFVDVILQIMKLGNNDLEIEIVPDSVIPSLRLNGSSQFGYGLFSS
jgi:hypothetical protein